MIKMIVQHPSICIEPETPDSIIENLNPAAGAPYRTRLEIENKSRNCSNTPNSDSVAESMPTAHLTVMVVEGRCLCATADDSELVAAPRLFLRDIIAKSLSVGLWCADVTLRIRRW